MIQGMIDDRHDDMKIYTLKQALQKLSNSPNDCTPQNIASLCRTGALTPLFPYTRYANDELYKEDDGRPVYEKSAVYHFDGYMTDIQLLKLLDGYADTIQLLGATPYQDSYETVLLAYPFSMQKYNRDENYTGHSDDDPYTVALDNIVFDAEQVEQYLAANAAGDQSELTRELLSKAQATIDRLQAENDQLRQAQTSQHDDEDMNPKRLKSVTHLLNVLFYKANYNIEDAHSGTVNHKIVELSRDKISNKTQISKKTVSYWIQQVQQLRIDNEQQ